MLDAMVQAYNPAIQEAEIRRIKVQGHPRQKI
jgi:hypothetical protein